MTTATRRSTYFHRAAPDGVIDVRDVLAPNENTIRADIAASDDYSVTLKDDGKLLYRWGTMIKRPNDIRMTAHMDLPSEWLTTTAQAANEGRGYEVLKAELIVSHHITNNPNDQLRPEDFENEAATGRKPSYLEIAHPDFPGDPSHALWVSTVDDFNGSGEFLPCYFKLDEFGQIITVPEPGDTVAHDLSGNVVGVVNTDTNGTPVGTVLREIGGVDHTTTTLLSSDLSEGFTDAWYTSMDRDPFEAVVDGQGEYIVGPRWRLKSGKFGQDLPSVDIPLIPHSQPPFTNNNLKYPVGELTTTTINLLDWEGESPLAYSNGWSNSEFVTGNGLQLTDQFDLAVYIKGDSKPTALYNAQLVLQYATPEIDGDFNDDGNHDVTDLDALVADIAFGGNSPQYDLTADGNVNLLDRDAWLAEAGSINLASGGSYRLGDATLDGFVDGDDFIAWNANKFTPVAAWSAGDFNASGFVDGEDFIAWNANKFTSADELAGETTLVKRSDWLDEFFAKLGVE